MRQGATGRGQGANRKTTRWRRENNRKAPGKRQGSDKGVTGEGQGSNRQATGERQGAKSAKKATGTRHGGNRTAAGEQGVPNLMVGESYCPSLPPCHHPAQCSTKNAPTRWTRYPWVGISPGCPPPYDHPNCGSPEHAGLNEQIPSLRNSQLRPFTRNPLRFLTSQGRWALVW